MFTHLHVHTEYSLLDGLSRLEPLVARAKELEMESLAITDHGGMYGAIDFYRLAKSAGIRPIIGCEMYVAPGSRHERNPADKTPFHMTVLAKNNVGYGNLVKLVTKSHLEGFYYKPRVDREALEEHHEGLIVLSGCPSGEVPSLIAQGRMDEATATASWYREVFGDYYLELMEHGNVPDLPAINQGLMRLHSDMGIPIVATNDSHYIKQDQAHLQDILICIHTNTNLKDEKRLRMEEDSYYLKSAADMAALYPNLPEALTNTQTIAEMCDIHIDFDRMRLPQYETPSGMSATEYLAKLCWDGLEKRLPGADETYRERLTYELEVIRQTQFDHYFLVVWDIAAFVRVQDIFFAVRGSAAASLTLYCLGVTDVDPMPYRLVFERFLNVERKEMPDIDMDFQDDRREEVINYVTEKYGREHVAQIITFGTMGAKAAVRDVGRALAMSYGDVDRIAKMIPLKLNITLEEAKTLSPELKETYDTEEDVRRLVDTAQGLEGLTRHSSTHAAGVVISEEPLNDVVPLQRPSKADENTVSTTTQYAMEPVAALGLLKMDFLGLVNLTVLARTRNLLAQNRGLQFGLKDIPLDDAKTFGLLSRGETAGVFQMEGAGVTRHIKELKPSSLRDVAAMIALYRPGPMEHIGTFIDAKFGRTQPDYPHPALKEILEETYGVIVYQDQVLHIARTFAGYSLGEADIVRKAMGKKNVEIMAQERQKFLEGAKAQGFACELAEKMFTLIEPFAGYAFNKAHSVSYGLISYFTAYFKANYPAEYMVSLLNSYTGNTDRVTTAIAECQRLNIPVLPPNVNYSGVEFTIENNSDGTPAIRYGLAAVKNVGAAAIKPILESRGEDGPYESIEQMCRSANMSGLKRNSLESLIRSGAFDDFGDRGALLTSIERILGLAQSEAGLRDSDQSSMFDLFGDSVPTPLANIVRPEVTTPSRDLETWERDLLGVALSSASSLASLLASAGSDTVKFRSDIGPEMAGKKISLVGQVSAVTHRFTKQNKPFAIASLSLMDGQVEVFVWEEQLDLTRDLWEEGKIVAVAGTVRLRDDDVSISCSDVKEYASNLESKALAATATPNPAGTAAIASPSAASVTSASPTSPDQPTTNGVHAPETNGTAAPALAHLPSTPPLPAEPQLRLNLLIRESANEIDDKLLLDDIKRLLLEFSGPDEVSLEIAAGGQVYRLDWPLVRVRASDELQGRLGDLLGESGRAVVESLAN